MPPLVYIVVLSWNGLADTLRCVVSLERQTYLNCRILVFDNGSTDGSVAALQALGTRIRLIESAVNLGYTGGNNRAMEAAFADGADYVWLFNNDAVAAPDTLATLVALAEADARIGLVSPVVREGAGADAAVSGCALIDLAGPFYLPTFDLAQAQDWQARFPDHRLLDPQLRRGVPQRHGVRGFDRASAETEPDRAGRGEAALLLLCRAQRTVDVAQLRAEATAVAGGAVECGAAVAPGAADAGVPGGDRGGPDRHVGRLARHRRCMGPAAADAAAAALAAGAVSRGLAVAARWPDRNG